MIETTQTPTSDGAVAGVRRAGSQGPALIFVHGVGSTAAIWDRQLEAFRDEYRCLAIELRGNGALRPDPQPSLITREGFATDVLAVADAAGIDNFTIVGCSLGGVVAFELWKSVPERIDAMVIVGSFARYPDAQTYAENISTAVREAGSMETFAQQRAAKLGLPPDRLRETLDQMASKSVSSYLASTQATWTGDYRDILATINVPVLVTYGEHDAIAPAALSEEIATNIPNAQLEPIKNAGHVANADNPEAFNHLLRLFLTSE
jgi:3-oxoadipate enol-lactonase